MDWRDVSLVTVITVVGNGILLWAIINYSYKRHSRLVKQKKREFSYLKAVSRIINEQPQLEVKIDLILDIIQDLMSASRALLLLNENLTSTLHTLKGRHDRILVRGFNEKGITGFLARKEPAVFQQCPASIASYLNLQGSIPSCILFPVKSGERDVALLVLLYLDTPLKKVIASHGILGEKLETLGTIVNQLGTAIEREALFQERISINENITGILSNILDTKNSYTHGHCRRVAQLAVALGRWLGMGPEEQMILNYGGLLHDLGKVQISDDILTKPEALTKEEFAEIRKHPEKGAQMLKRLEFFREVAACIQYHHERFDGTGYPSGLKGEQIPLYARIIAVADSFDAMISARSYGRVLTREEALAELVKCAGSQFDPVLVIAFVKMMRGNNPQEGEGCCA